MNRVVTPPLKPPLKTSNLLLTGIGGCSGKAISTLVVPLPMIALLHAFSAPLVSRDCSWPDLQTGRPLTLMAPFLSVSTMASFSAGGCDPSLVAILPSAVKVIGASFFLGSLVGLKPPLTVTTRFPASTVTGLLPALAIPTTLTAIRAAMAIVNNKYLRISLFLSFAALPVLGRCRRISFERLSSRSNYHPDALRKPRYQRKRAVWSQPFTSAASAAAPARARCRLPLARGKAASPRTSGPAAVPAAVRRRRGGSRCRGAR